LTQGRAHVRRLFHWAQESWKAVVGIAVGISAIAGAVTIVHSAVGGSHCGAADGTIKVLDLGNHVTYGGFLELQRTKEADVLAVPARSRRRVGKTVHYRVAAVGYGNHPLDVRWVVVTAGGEPVPERELRDQLDRTVRPKGCSDEVESRIWFQPPRARGAYRVELRLYDRQNELGHDEAKFTV
jgi:hypothetical protein